MSTAYWTRRSFLSLPAAAALPRGGFGAASGKPNIVFILADDLGYGDLGCYGAVKIRTPHTDALAAAGVRFTDAHSGSSVCTPTRYGILTGRYSWRTRLQRGVLYGYDEPLIERGRLTVPALLKQHGYYTGGVGKWHLGLRWALKDPKAPAEEKNIDFKTPIREGPLTTGFDYYFGISASLDMPPYIYIENDRTVGQPTAWMEKHGAVRAGVREPSFQTVNVLPDLARKAVEFIDEHARRRAGQPFFLYLALTSPHTPVVPTDAFKGRSQAGEYGDFVMETDWAVGEVMKALDRHGLSRDTLLMVTSDNGSTNPPMTEYSHRPNGPWRGRKSTIWDGGHRIPFVARWPARIKPGLESAEPVCLGDLLATSAALVGAKLPSNAGEDSYNILPALLGEKMAKPIREAVVHHSIEGIFSIRQWPWKLILGRGSGGWDGAGSPSDPPGQLYHLEKDPTEADNLYTKYPDIVARLTALLDKYKREGRSRPL